MGNMRDQLKKAKLLSEKKSRQLAHQERVHRKQVGREGLEQEEKERRDEVQRLQQQEREAQQETQQQLDERRRAEAEYAACLDILRNDAIRPKTRGGSRWYFEIEGGALPWFEVDEAMRFQLQSGAYWVVRTGPPDSHVYALLPAPLGQRVHASMPELIVWAPGIVPGGAEPRAH